MNNKKELFDCIISCGELDPERYGKLLDNEHYRFIVVKPAVTKEEVDTWLYSDERRRHIDELRNYGEQVFGREHWRKFHINCYYTKANIQNDKRNE